MIVDSVQVYYEIFLASNAMNKTIIVDILYYTMKVVNVWDYVFMYCYWEYISCH